MQHASNQGAADILIPVRNHYAYTRTLLEGIYRYTDCPFHTYVIHHAIAHKSARGSGGRGSLRKGSSHT